eukprot:NODE_1247_length_1023_cov_244.506160_g865_i0.p2 GENE.NODE_1247_length_1023_cov_244.506160_g865_i0~~NODE_1247_length_1023_cov_244.506160_g865_i0.p2  ORF type:complete len:103 (+),score=17.58 NODE_1247_length_1023_cov_244.506160_g865_i0:277-585(+)
MTEELGYRTKHMSPDIFYLGSIFYFDHDGPAKERGMNPLNFMDWLDHQDPVLAVPRELVMVGRLAIMLRGFANAFGMEISLANTYRKYAEAVLKLPAPAATD